MVLCLAISPYLLSREAIAQSLYSIPGDEMSQISISVSVDDVHLPQIKQISQQLQSLGMTVEQVLPTTGIITGSIQSDNLDSYYQIEGVKNIEPQQGYQLSPPSSDVQ